MEPGCSNGSSKRVFRSNSEIKQVECGKQPRNSSKGASFIKLLGRDFSNQLQIPHEFTMIFNGYVPHRLIIESATSKKCWRVEVEEELDGTIYFREGWADFVEAHHLEVGNFLLFEYEEQSIVLVKIYNRNGSQKMALDAQEGKGNPVKVTDIEEEENNDSFGCEPENLETSCPPQERTKRLFTRKYGNGLYKKRRTIPSKYARTARVSFNENGVSYTVKIHKYLKHQLSQLEIPKAILLSRAKKLVSKDIVILENATGNRWPVKLAHRKDGRTVLSLGWAAFVRDNDVAAGDLLCFEDLSDEVVKFHVNKASQGEPKSDKAKSQNGATIAPNMDWESNESDLFEEVEERELSKCEAQKLGTSSPQQERTKRLLLRKYGNGKYKKKRPTRSKYVRTVRVWLTENSMAFSIKIHKYRNHQLLQLKIPKEISRAKKLVNKDEVILEDAMGNRWPVGLIHICDGRTALGRGWNAFVKHISVAAGDSLSFEFVSDDLIKVCLTKGSQAETKSDKAKSRNGATIAPNMNGKFDDLDSPCDNDVDGTKASIATMPTKMGRKGGSSKLTSSSFYVLWRPATAGSYMYVPKVITEAQNLINKDSVVLRDPDGKCWPVEISSPPRRDGRVALLRGWDDFCKGQSIKAGDSLHFEFVSEYVIQVKVNRGESNGSDLLEEEEDSDPSECEPKSLGTRRPQQERTKRLSTKKYGNRMYQKKHAAIPSGYVRTARVWFNENNMAFSVIMHKFKNHQLVKLYIPKEISLAKKLVTKDELILEDAIGNRWPIKLIHISTGRTALSRGWPTFLKDNNIEAGDSLSFEFVSDDLVKVRVTKGLQAGRKSDKANSQIGAAIAPNTDWESYGPHSSEEKVESDSEQCKTKNLRTSCPPQGRATRQFTRKYGNGMYKRHVIPSKHTRTARVSLNDKSATFCIKIHKHMKHQLKQLKIPKAVSLTKLVGKDKLIIEDPTGNRWPVKLSHMKDGRAVFTGGWRTFVRDKDVSAHDSLSFEFVSDDLVKVRVTKASRAEQKSGTANSENGATISPNTDYEFDELDTGNNNVDDPEASINTIRDKKRGSSELSSSSFSFFWGPATAGDFMYVPKVVTEGQNLMNKDSVVLRDPEGKCWPVELRTRRNRRGGYVVLSRGWVEFWKGQVLKTGDLLDFEFVSEYVIQVKVKRWKSLKSHTKFEADIIDLSSASDDESPTEAETVMTGPEFPELVTALPAAITDSLQ